MKASGAQLYTLIDITHTAAVFFISLSDKRADGRPTVVSTNE